MDPPIHTVSIPEEIIRICEAFPDTTIRHDDNIKKQLSSENIFDLDCISVSLAYDDYDDSYEEGIIRSIVRDIAHLIVEEGDDHREEENENENENENDVWNFLFGTLPQIETHTPHSEHFESHFEWFKTHAQQSFPPETVLSL